MDGAGQRLRVLDRGAMSLIIRAGLRSLLRTVTSARRLRLLMGIFIGVAIGNVTATLSDGKPDRGSFMVGLVMGVGITALTVIMTLEASDKIKQSKVNRQRAAMTEQTATRVRRTRAGIKSNRRATQ